MLLYFNLIIQLLEFSVNYNLLGDKIQKFIFFIGIIFYIIV